MQVIARLATLTSGTSLMAYVSIKLSRKTYMRIKNQDSLKQFMYT